MKYLLLFEAFDIESHLKDRGIDVKKTRTIIDKERGDTYFFLYNLSGQMVGYQKYNPDYPKAGQSKAVNPRLVKYFTLVSEDKIGVWGLESLKFTDKYLFVVEGIFDAARIHECGYPAIAVLCNDPDHSTRSWISTLPQTKIVIFDNDKAGMRLKSAGDYAFSVTIGNDMNDLSIEEAGEFLIDCLGSI